MIVVDTGVILAAASSSDRHHVAAATLLAARRDELVTPMPVIVESSWMIESVLGPAAEASFVTAVANGELGEVDLGTVDLRRCAELIEQYADLGLGLVDASVDASVVAVAERMSLGEVATLNHRDFRVVRPRHRSSFMLLP